MRPPTVPAAGGVAALRCRGVTDRRWGRERRDFVLRAPVRGVAFSHVADRSEHRAASRPSRTETTPVPCGTGGTSGTKTPLALNPKHGAAKKGYHALKRGPCLGADL